MIIHIAIPRFALSGGNLVSLELASYLEKEGLTVFCLSGSQIKRAHDVVLVKPNRGIFNSFKNLCAFFFLSVQALFCKNYIATHHLTSIFNFIKRSQFSLIQDVEVDFYPQRLKRLGKIFWKNYLASHHLIFTNPTLATRIVSDRELDVKGLSFVPFDIYSTETLEKDIDAVAIIRDGKYKDPIKTLQVMMALEGKNYNVLIINASRQVLSGENFINNVNRKEFLDILLKTKVFICLSQWEGLGLPNLEAFACGCHVVSTAIPSALVMQEHAFEGINVLEEQCSVATTVSKIEQVLRTNKFPAVDINARLNLLKHIQRQWLDDVKEKIIKGKSL